MTEVITGSTLMQSEPGLTQYRDVSHKTNSYHKQPHSQDSVKDLGMRSEQYGL